MRHRVYRHKEGVALQPHEIQIHPNDLALVLSVYGDCGGVWSQVEDVEQYADEIQEAMIDIMKDPINSVGCWVWRFKLSGEIEGVLLSGYYPSEESAPGDE